MERLTRRWGPEEEQISGHAICEFNTCPEDTTCASCVYGKKNNRLADIEDILGDNYDLDRLKELTEADREGRIAVFPCKPSDVTVYQLRNKKHALGMGVHPRHVGCAKVWGNGKYELLHGGNVPCKDKDFGKTWFLKEDEAQAALKAMKEREENDCTCGSRI